MFNFKYLNKKGFTLIEMLVVIGIIGMLSSFVAYSFSSSRPKARLAVVQTQMNNLHPYLVICANAGTTVDFTGNAPVGRSIDPENPTKVCSTANDVAVFEDLPANWQYTISAVDSYRACTTELGITEVVCDETGCATNSEVGVTTCP